jgi:RNA recognition motif-containing protein
MPAEESDSLSQRIYVGNLPFETTEEDLSAQFKAYGELISVALPTDRDTGRPRGFGFIEMSSEDASKAIEGLNGTDFGGRSMSVSEARAREERGSSAPRGGGYNRR